MNEKRYFLEKEFPRLLPRLQPDAKGKWGVMNAQQMVEHVADSVRIASGKISQKSVLTPEQVQKAYLFMMSEKLFRENTPNQLLPEVPPPWKNKSIGDAIAELQQELEYFFKIYASSPGLKITNPFFGDLGFEEQLHLLHKHAVHHARQFNLL